MLVIVGGLNWGLVAVAEFDLVAALFGLDFGALLGGALATWLGLRPTFLVAAAVSLAVLVGFRWVTAEAVARAEAAEAPTG